MTDSYLYVIIALLPLASLMLVFQVNPYHALVIRAILGAIAVLVYVVLGGADVALTEALVGTMLAIALYVVAVRSSLVMRLGILKNFPREQDSYWERIIANLRKIVHKYHLRLELVEYPDAKSLKTALMTKEVHAICSKSKALEPNNEHYHTTVRVDHLFEILQTELTSWGLVPTYLTLSKEVVSQTSNWENLH